MAIKSKSDLPEGVKNSLPSHGQEIWLEAYNSAYQEYADPEDRRDNRDREETAARVAWSAVKNKYKKVTESKWMKK